MQCAKASASSLGNSPSLAWLSGVCRERESSGSATRFSDLRNAMQLSELRHVPAPRPQHPHEAETPSATASAVRLSTSAGELLWLSAAPKSLGFRVKVPLK